MSRMGYAARIPAIASRRWNTSWSGWRHTLTRIVIIAIAMGLGVTAWLLAQPSGDPLIEGFRGVEVASVADAMEQLYGQRSYMSHHMRPLFTTKFAGPAVTVLMKKEEHKLGAAASQGM